MDILIKRVDKSIADFAKLYEEIWSEFEEADYLAIYADECERILNIWVGQRICNKLSLQSKIREFLYAIHEESKPD